MKTLNEFLSAKVKPVVAIPNKPKLDDFVQFLDEMHIRRHMYSWTGKFPNKFLEDIVREIDKLAQKYDHPGFILADYDDTHEYSSLRMWNPGKISRENPILYITLTNDGHQTNNFGFKYALETTPGKRILGFDEWEDVKKQIEKQFCNDNSK